MKYRIWSIEHQGWWKLGEMGYTQDRLLAGIYEEKRVHEIVLRANRYLKPTDIPHEALVPVEEDEP